MRVHYEESLAVAIVEEDVLASVAARGEMIHRARVFEAQRLGHGATLGEDRWDGSMAIQE
jgi:hypothetical protein